jgi:hypothetical protein
MDPGQALGSHESHALSDGPVNRQEALPILPPHRGYEGLSREDLAAVSSEVARGKEC